MVNIIVTTETRTWQTDGPDDDYLNGVPYSYRGSESGEVTNVTAYVGSQTIGYGCESLSKDIPGVDAGTTLYAVVADYESGDTFGRTGGHSQVLDVFTTSEEAESLARAARDLPFSGQFGFEHNGQQYYVSWMGYFESLNSLDVWEIVLRSAPRDPFTSPSGNSIGHKRGK